MNELIELGMVFVLVSGLFLLGFELGDRVGFDRGRTVGVSICDELLRSRVDDRLRAERCRDVWVSGGEKWPGKFVTLCDR